MIKTMKIAIAHQKALYWKRRAEKADYYMRRNLDVLSTVGSGKWETEYGYFVVSENNQYPADKIREQLTPEQEALCYEARWSNARARVLFPDVVQSVKVQNGYKVSI